MKNTDKQKKIPHEKFMRIKNAEEKRRMEERLKAIRDKAEREGRLNLIDIRKMDDRQVVEKLLNRDDDITAEFFFVKCRPLLLDIISYVFGGRRVSYDEVVAEIYYYLMRPNTKGEDAAVLKTFEFRSSLYQWFKFVIIHFLIRNRQRLLNGNKGDADLSDTEAFKGLDDAVGKIADVDDGDKESPWAVMDAMIRRQEAVDQIQAIFDKMTEGKKGRALNGAQNYINVLKMKYLKDMDDKEIATTLNIKTDNLYMLKGRAVRAFRAAAMDEMKEEKYYEKG